ncbi:MAG TPA: hypothetical protein DDX14_10235, partial [Cyanobacteria bacterium UBA9579]|nr:hypothetical protein [Cyanobacteria bacterium UBA9579]
MKILLTNNHFSNYGGADTYTYHTGKLLRENGHEIFFFASNRGIFFDENYEYSRYFPQYVSYRSLSKHQLIGNVFKPFYNFEAKTKLNQYIKEIKPDIVHCNCISYHLTPSILDSCYENNIPIIMTLHDARFLCPAGPLMRGTETYCQDELCIKGNPIHCLINKCKYKSLPASALATFEYFFNRALKIFNKVSMFICPSNALLELAV